MARILVADDKENITKLFRRILPADYDVITAEDGTRALALVTSMDIRRYVRRMIAARLPRLQVYSYQELGEHLALKPVGRVAM